MTRRLRDTMAALLLWTAGCGTALAEPGLELTLSDCLRRAARSNPAVLAARAGLDRAEGVIQETRADALPQLGFGAGYTRLDRGLIEGFDAGEQGGVVIGDDEEYEYGFSASQLLYRGGEVRSDMRIAGLGREAADRRYRSVLADTLLAVRITFYEVLRDLSQIDVQEQTVDLLERGLQWTRNRFDAGTVPRLEVLRAEVELANALPGLIRARNQYRLSRERLATLISLDRPTTGADGDMLPLADGAFPPIDPLPPLRDMLASALANRPELQRLHLEERIGEEAIASAGAGRRPTLSVQADYGWRSSAFVAGEEVSGWRAMARADVPIFDGMRTQGKVRQARASLDETRSRSREQRLAVKLETRAAHGNVLEAIEFIASQEKNGERAKEALRLAAASYEAGKGTQLDLLDARVALTAARSLQVQAEYAYSAARARLEYAAGLTDAWLEPAGDAAPSPAISRDTSGERTAAE